MNESKTIERGEDTGCCGAAPLLDDPLELLKWVVVKRHLNIEPFPELSELYLTPQKYVRYRCRGCTGMFVSRPPKWENPAFSNVKFPHRANCKYMAVMRLVTSNV